MEQQKDDDEDEASQHENEKTKNKRSKSSPLADTKQNIICTMIRKFKTKKKGGHWDVKKKKNN